MLLLSRFFTFRVIDSNFFYQRRGLMFDVSDLIFRSNLSLIQFSRYELYISGIYVPGVLHAISTQEPFPGCSSHAKRWIYIEKAYEPFRSCGLTQGFFKKMSGSRLLSHAVSSIVPSAARIFTVVFGMGTGVASARIATRQIYQCDKNISLYMRIRQKRNPYFLSLERR